MRQSVDLFLAGINNGAFLLCVAFIGYVMLIIVPFVKRTRGRPGDSADFEWHFIVPCLDEGAVIAETVRRLVVDFPTAHVWCVDDGSTDGTARVLAWLSRRSRRIHVIVRKPPYARQGKGPALNAGWRAISRWLPAEVDTSRVIVGVLDADGRLDRRCLDVVAGRSQFGNPAIGAVQIQVRVVDPSVRGRTSGHIGRLSRLLVHLQDVEFTSSIAAMQTLRRHTGSVGMGGNGQFTRLSVLDRIAADHGAPWHGALLEDFELGLHVLMAGSRTEYCHDTYVEQEGLTSLRSLVRQRSRWAQGSMQCFSYMAPILRSPRINNTGAVEIAYFLLLPWLQLLGALLYIVSAGVLTWFIFNTPGGPSAWYSFGGWGVLPLFVLFGIMPLAVWAFVYRKMTDPSMTRRRAAALGLANWPYTFVHYLASWWALVRMLRGRHDWKKTERHGDLATVESPRPAPVAASKTAHARPPQQRPQQPRVPSRPAAAGRAPVAADWENAIVPYVGPKRTVPARPGHAHVRSSAASHFASSTRSGDASATVGTVPVPGVHSQ